MEGMTIRSPAGRPVLAAPTGSYEPDGPVDASVAKRALAQGCGGEAALQPDAASGGLRLFVILCGLLTVHQAAVCDCCTLDAFTLDQDCLGPAEVDSAGVRLLRLS